jgi:hypothetical protein
MGFQRRTEYQNVIEEDDYKFSQTRGKSSIHRTLECAWGARESEGHHTKLILAEVCLKGCFKFLTIPKQNLVKSCPQVQCRKSASMSKLVHKLVEDRHWKLGFHCQRVEVAEINTEPVSTILFRTKSTSEENGLLLCQMSP